MSPHSDCRWTDFACEHGTGGIVSGRKKEDVLIAFWFFVLSMLYTPRAKNEVDDDYII